MRITNNDPRTRGSQTSDGLIVTMNISFTGNAISYLSAANEKGIDLKEWIWHEQIVNGELFYVITDKVIGTSLAAG